MKIAEAVKEYLNDLKQKNLSENTIERKRWYLKKICLNLNAQGITKVNQLNETIIQEIKQEEYYYINRKNRQNTPSTRNTRLAVLRCFLKYLYEKEYLDHLINLEYFKQAYLRLPKDILTKQELIKLFKQPDIQNIYGFRDRVMLEVLYATGMRRMELANLKIKDIDFAEHTVFIRKGKGKKDRVVPINETAQKYLRNYLSEIRPKLLKPGSKNENKSENENEHIFLRTEGQKLNSSHAGDILRKYFKKAKFKHQVSIHSIRHTVATRLLQKGMALRHVQELLGHDGLDTTIKYLHLNIQDLQREYKKYHPREKQS